jgi:hypothetical protein
MSDKAEQARKGAASWFWWIGALSILNSILAMNGKQLSLTFGLGIAQIGDTWMAGDSGLFQTLGLFLTFGGAGFFLLMGWLAHHWEAAFRLGIAAYGLDAIVFLAAEDFLGLAFHAFALFVISAGYHSWRRALYASRNFFAP